MLGQSFLVVAEMCQGEKLAGGGVQEDVTVR